MSFRETLTLWLVLITTLWNALRLWTALAWRDTLTEFAGADAVSISIAGGALWTLAGAFAALALLLRWKWERQTLAALALAYSAWYWAERLLWQAPRANWLFAAIVNGVLLVFVLSRLKRAKNLS